jgi:hypothetical protein
MLGWSAWTARLQHRHARNHRHRDDRRYQGLARQVIELLGLIVSFWLRRLRRRGWRSVASRTHPFRMHALVLSFIVVFVSGLVAFHFVAIASRS